MVLHRLEDSGAQSSMYKDKVRASRQGGGGPCQRPATTLPDRLRRGAELSSVSEATALRLLPCLIFARRPQLGRTPLISAAASGRYDVVEFLAKADPPSVQMTDEARTAPSPTGESHTLRKPSLCRRSAGKPRRGDSRGQKM